MVSKEMTVTCGQEQTFAIGENGQVFATGSNELGQLGLGDNLRRLDTTRVAGLPAPVRQVATAAHHTGMVTEAGDLFMCGFGGYGRLGLGDEEDRTTPTQVARAVFDGEAVLMVACGFSHTAVATEGGGVYTFGYGYFGQLGHGDEKDQLLPRRIPAAAFNGERVVFVAAGRRHTVALSDAGHVFTWGYGEDGQLGHGDEEKQLIPRQVEARRFGGDAPERVVFVAAGRYHTAAVTAGGRLYTWGSNGFGQLGHGDTKNKLVPTLVVGPTGSAFGGSAVVMVACGLNYTMVVTEDGGLWTCGCGYHGKLGLNNTKNTNVFEQVSSRAFDGARVVAAAAGYAHSAAVTEDGALWTWGNGQNGQIGHGFNVQSSSSPRRVTASPLDTIRIGRFLDLLPAHVLAFTMGAHYRLGAASPLRNVSGEEGLLSMIAQFGNTSLANLPPAVKNSKGLLRLLGVSKQRYQMRMTVPASSEVP